MRGRSAEEEAQQEDVMKKKKPPVVTAGSKLLNAQRVNALSQQGKATKWEVREALDWDKEEIERRKAEAKRRAPVMELVRLGLLPERFLWED